MNQTYITTKIPTPPAFMATTRQKILLRQQHLDVAGQGTHSNALELLSNITKDILSIAKRA